jgi:hypothetical protein
VHVALIAMPYNLLERLRLVVTRQRGEVLEEDFGADVTMTIRLPVDSFDMFQNDLRELSAGKIQAEIIETKEMVISLGSAQSLLDTKLKPPSSAAFPWHRPPGQVCE